MSRRTCAAAPRLTVLLCRGCCCGTAQKHPSTDHDRQEQALRTAVQADDGLALRVVECLDECDRSNVVVLRGASGRPAERDTWLGGVLGERATGALAGWLAGGAHGSLPPAVAGLRFRHLRPRERR